MKVETTLVLTKITPGAVRFDHPDSKMSSHDPNYPKITSLYVRKTAYPDGQFPKEMKITAEW